jgi:hypothetical protein
MIWQQGYIGSSIISPFKFAQKKSKASQEFF